MDRRAVPTGRTHPAEAGVALLIVLVVLFIVAVLMVDISLTASTARRSAGNATSEFLMNARIEAMARYYQAQIEFGGMNGAVDSLNDRWAREEYAEPDEDDSDKDPWAAPAEGEERAPRTRWSTSDVTILRDETHPHIEDEERKFNLYTLLSRDTAVAKDSAERLATLIDRFREETPFDISRTRAEQLRDKVLEYLKRPAPSEGETGKLPRPKSELWPILTPDELVNIEGFEVDDVSYRAREILYDTRDLEEVRAYEEDPENLEPPEVHPGLLRYLTLWSGRTWEEEPKGTPRDVATWFRINLNTAEKPVLETLFRNPTDYALVEKIIEYRDTTAEDAPETDTGEGDGASTPDKQVFKNAADLDKVEGLKAAFDDPKRSYPGTWAFESNTFSLNIRAKHERAIKQVRYVIRREREQGGGKLKSLRTLLREERVDPFFDREEGEEGEEE